MNTSRKSSKSSELSSGKISKVGNDSPKDNPLQEVFLQEMADIYDAEQQVLKALPKMAKEADSEELRQGFENHLAETLGQVRRIEEAVKSLGETLQKKNCAAMEGLLEEGTEMMTDHEGQPTIDAVLIAAAQKVEHYEIASYGTLSAWAEELGHDHVVELLEETLLEEKATDEKLTEIAEQLANARAKKSS